MISFQWSVYSIPSSVFRPRSSAQRRPGLLIPVSSPRSSFPHLRSEAQLPPFPATFFTPFLYNKKGIVVKRYLLRGKESSI